MFERLFALLTRCLPSHVRRRYAAEMRATFRARVAAARRAGGRATLRLVIREYFDLLRAPFAPALRVNPGDAPSPTPDESSHGFVGLSLDVRWAWRTLIKQPGFTAAAVATLALGIGATTAVFSVLHAVLLAPLPFPDADRLVALFHGTPDQARGSHSPVALLDYERRARSLAHLGMYDEMSAVVSPRDGDAERLEGARVSAGFFAALAVHPVHGRGLDASDITSDAARVVISEALWQRRFGRRDVLGTSLTIDGRVHDVVGVLGAPATLPAGTEFWVPLVLTADDLRPNQRGAHYLGAIARLRPDITAAQAQADIDRVTAELAAALPNYHQGTVLAVVPLHEALTERVRPTLVALGAAVVLVLLIAAANVANLLLARSTSRQAEMALRASLGASRGRIVRQCVVESLLLSTAGALAGLLLAAWTTRSLVAAAPVMPAFATVSVHLPVILFTLAMSLTIGVLFGMLPALAMVRREMAGAIREGGDGRTFGSSRRQLRRGLAAAEIALALMLLVGAVLLLRTAANLQRVDPGFDPSNVLTFRLTLPAARAGSPEAILATYDRVLGELTSTPGVARAALALGAPFSQSNPFTSFSMPGLAETPEPLTRMRVVWGDYFGVLGIPVRQGRAFDARDTTNAPLVAVVNEAFVRAYLPGVPPIGQTLRLHASLTRDAPRGPRAIVGVVGDVRQQRLTGAPEADVFIPYGQHALAETLAVVRTDGPPLDLVNTIRARLRTIDPLLPLSRVASMDQLIGATTTTERFTGMLLNIFAGIAALLAAVGLYGVLAFDVAQRRREIGVRVALGATRSSVLGLFLRDAMRVAAVGLAIGIAGAVAMGGLLETLLFGVDRSDPSLIAIAAGGMLCLSVLAGSLPALRASKLDPLQALRQ
jgi:putative ABC transport system permease protein